MNEYHEIQRHIDEVTMTTAERRHEHQRKEAARRLKQIEDRRNKLVERARNARTSLGESLHFGLCAELADCVEKLEAESYELVQQLAAKQAEVDALMLEYCPSEMSQEQLDNWAAHQRPAKEQ